MPLPEVEKAEQPAKVLDLMAALNASVEQAKAARSEDADVHELPREKAAPARKPSAKKKAAAKKASGRRLRTA